MTTIKLSDAVKLYKVYKEDLWRIDEIQESVENKRRMDDMQKTIDRLNRKIIKLENQKCLYRNADGMTRPTKKAMPTRSQAEILMDEIGMSHRERNRICSKYGSYAGARNYCLRTLGRSVPEIVDQCDEAHQRILSEYRRIRDTEGIKQANDYFNEANGIGGIL